MKKEALMGYSYVFMMSVGNVHYGMSYFNTVGFAECEPNSTFIIQEQEKVGKFVWCHQLSGQKTVRVSGNGYELGVRKLGGKLGMRTAPGPQQD